MKIIGYSIGKDLIVNSNGDICKDGYLDWLMKPEEDSIRVFLDMKQDVLNLIKMCGIGIKDSAELYESTKCRVESYKFRYIPEKFFSIKKNGTGFGYYCNVSQYFRKFNREYANDLYYYVNNQNKQESLAIIAKNDAIKIIDVLSKCDIEVKSLTSLERIYENTSQEVKSKIDYNWLKEEIRRELEK